MVNTHRFRIPLTREDVESVRIGDLVYLDGLIHTGRGLVYEHVEKGNPPEIDLGSISNVQMHSAPAGIRDDSVPGGYRISSIQATASFRYWKWVPDYVERFQIRALIGKAGMDEVIYRDVFTRTGTIFLTTVGYGVAALYGRAIKRVHSVHWERELGLPEAMWVIEVENFGPFIVDGDVTGASLAAQSIEKVNVNFRRAYSEMPQHVLKRIGEISQDLEHEVIMGAAGCPEPPDGKA